MQKKEFEFSRQNAKFVCFLFFLSKDLVMGHLDTKFEENPSGGSGVYLGVPPFSTLFTPTVPPVRELARRFNMGIFRGSFGT